MFTGIVTAIGTIEDIRERGDTRVRIACPFDASDVAIGASIACSGVCLTVVERGGNGKRMGAPSPQLDPPPLAEAGGPAATGKGASR